MKTMTNQEQETESRDTSAQRHPGLLKMAREGRVRLGRPNDPALYPPRPVRSPAGTAAHLLAEERGER